MGAIVGAGHAGTTKAPLSCRIDAAGSGGMIALEAVVEAESAVSGWYDFRIVGVGRGGGSDIIQGGPFVAQGSGSVTLGRVALGGDATYDASLEIASDGGTSRCSRRIYPL
jgi:hypothetical protein